MKKYNIDIDLARGKTAETATIKLLQDFFPEATIVEGEKYKEDIRMTMNGVTIFIEVKRDFTSNKSGNFFFETATHFHSKRGFTKPGGFIGAAENKCDLFFIWDSTLTNFKIFEVKYGVALTEYISKKVDVKELHNPATDQRAARTTYGYPFPISQLTERYLFTLEQIRFHYF